METNPVRYCQDIIRHFISSNSSVLFSLETLNTCQNIKRKRGFMAFNNEDSKFNTWGVDYMVLMFISCTLFINVLLFMFLKDSS